MSKYEKCPKCGKKGRFISRGYDPSPERGPVENCRYCNYTRRLAETSLNVMTLTKAQLEELMADTKDVEIDIPGKGGQFAIRVNGIDVSDAVSTVTFDFENGTTEIDWKMSWVAAQEILDTFK